MEPIFRAYPRHSVDISATEHRTILSLLFSSKILSGDYIQKFELRFARYIGIRHSISLSSARLGLYLILKYYNFPEGTEVIITPFTHRSIFTVIRASRLKPIFCDINENTYNVDAGMVRKVVNRKTKLLILTHMWGQTCKMDDFLDLKKEYNLKIIEDCAMAAGAEYANRKAGSFGDASIFSFGKAKAINAFGGGMLCTDNMEIASYVSRVLSSYNYEKRNALTMTIINSVIANILTRPEIFFFTLYPVMKFLNIRDPYNPAEHKKQEFAIMDKVPKEWMVRFSNAQAVVAIEQLNNLDRHNDRRILNANILRSILSDIEGVRAPLCLNNAKHIYLYYALYIKKHIDLNFLRQKLIRLRIDSQLNELTGPKELEVFGADPDHYPIFKDVSRRLLIIPNGIYLMRNDILYIAKNVKKIMQELF